MPSIADYWAFVAAVLVFQKLPGIFALLTSTWQRRSQAGVAARGSARG